MWSYAILVAIIPFGIFFPIKNRKKEFLYIWGMAAILLYALHGDFTADYKAYLSFFRMHATYTWNSIGSIININYHFNYIEVGYTLLDFIISRFTTNYFYMQLCQAIIICVPVIICLKKSSMPLLSICLYLAIGPYLESYNTVRGFMAVSICFLAFKYIKTHELRKYVFIIILASLIHLSALIMLPFYWILQWQPTWITIAKYVVCTILAVVALDKLATIYNYFFKVATNNAVIQLLYNSQTNIVTIFVPVFFALCTLILFKIRKSNKSNVNQEEAIMFNGTIIWMVLKILTLITGYATRFAGYFACFIWMFYPYVLSTRIKKEGRSFLVVSTMIICMIYYLIQTKAYGSYYTMFQSAR